VAARRGPQFSLLRGTQLIYWISLLLFVVVIVIVVAVLLGSRRNAGAAVGFPYEKSKTLFSPAERSFLGVLEQALSSEHRVFGKVRIADVAQVKTMSNRSLRQRAFNSISSKHFDFVICNVGDLGIVCVVELDDKSHQENKRKARDTFVVGLCQAIALPLLQVPAQRAYSVPELKAKILLALRPASAANA
jgi:hypothetical protein